MTIIAFFKRKLGIDTKTTGGEDQSMPFHDSYESSQADNEQVKSQLGNINDSILGLGEELHRIPASIVAELKDHNREVIEKLDNLPGMIIGPLKEVTNLSKQEIMTELMRISSHRDSHDSNDSGIARTETAKPIHEISRELTGKQKKLLALLLDSGFLSYAEIGEKLGIAHESAKNFVNRLLKDRERAKLFLKQETEAGIKVGVSNEIQDEILKEKYRTKSNDSA